MIERLVSCLRVLAAPANRRSMQYPDFPSEVAALTGDFSDALFVARQCSVHQLTSSQRGQLDDLEQLLEQLNDPDNAALRTAAWTAPSWVAVREAAARALRALGLEPPSP